MNSEIKTYLDVKGWLTEAEGNELARLAEGKRVLEIGSYHGRSTVCMASRAEHITAVDWGKGDPGAGTKPSTAGLLANIERFGLVDKVTVHAKRIGEVHLQFADHSFDMVFIDGAHDEMSVISDAAVAKRVVKPGGIIAFHDWGYPSVQSAAWQVLRWKATGGTTVGSLHWDTWGNPE